MYSDRLRQLLDIYEVVNRPCFPAAAKAVVSYMDHLKTMQDVETIAETNCPSSMQFTAASFTARRYASVLCAMVIFCLSVT